MTEQQKQFPEFYVTASQTCPYVPGRSERKLFTHLTHDKPVALVDTLLRGGFRRSQNIAYMPYCEGCRSCVPVRVLVDEFEPGRTMRRILRRNGDLVSRRIPATPTSEQYALFRTYIEHRHGDGGMSDMSVLDYAMMIEDSIIDTFITEYRLRPAKPDGTRIEKWPLIAVALSDRLSDGVSMVYSFYDPLCDDRSLGTLMILDHIQHTKALGLPYLYLGYWIRESRKMRYKSRFTPMEALGPGGWASREFPDTPED